MNNETSLYIHIPYCKSKCGYCDFCSFTDLSTKDAYTAELIRRLAGYSQKAGRVPTVYFGGGTPSVIGAKALTGLLAAIKDRCDLCKDCEITLEVNPGTVGKDELALLRSAGFNRLSAGIQTSNETELKLLGRTSHTVKDGKTLVKNAREAGFDNISLDLMYGIPDQTLASFEESVDFVCSLHPEHISSYALKLEENTPLYKRREKLDLPDDDLCADMYLMLNEKLKEYGYQRYEISNFAKPGFESRHNLRYWEGGDYLGVGVSAASLYGDVRYLQSSDMSSFLSGKEPDTVETLDEDGKKLEYIMLHLRLAKGVCKAEFKEKFGSDFDTEYQSRIKKYGDHGFAVNTEKNFYLTEKGLLVSNAIISDFIY